MRDNSLWDWSSLGWNSSDRCWSSSDWNRCWSWGSSDRCWSWGSSDWSRSGGLDCWSWWRNSSLDWGDLEGIRVDWSTNWVGDWSGLDLVLAKWLEHKEGVGRLGWGSRSWSSSRGSRLDWSCSWN